MRAYWTRIGIAMGAVLLSSCASPEPPAPGFRGKPAACDLVSNAVLTKYAQPQEQPHPPEGSTDPDVTDNLEGKCTWEVDDPKGRGDFGSARLILTVSYAVDEDTGEPSVHRASEIYELDSAGKLNHSLPKQHTIGEQSTQTYIQSSPLNQKSQVTFRKSNANVTVDFSAGGYSYAGNRDILKPRPEFEATARAIARDVARNLGNPN